MTTPPAAPSVPPPSARAPDAPRPVATVVLWLGLYLAAVTAPLFLLLLGGSAGGAGFVWDFALALGYAGLAMLGVLFVLTARFRRATAPFGIDVVYYFHRYVAVAALLLVGSHWLLLRLGHPLAVGSAWPPAAPPHMTAGRLALLLFATVVVASLLRRTLRLDYDRWRIAHAALSTTAYVLALAHVLGAGGWLDEPWKRGVWIAYGSIWILAILYVRLLRPWLLLRHPYRVREVRPERGSVWTLVLEPVAAARLRFSPGQFVWLVLGSSPFAMREHPFSIASAATRPDTIELGIKELGDFTSRIKDVRPGATAWLDGCYGSFCVDRHPAAKGYVFVAGGIGIAPILSMLRTLADRGEQRPLLLFYGNRTWERVPFREELERLATRLRLGVVHVLREPPAGWRGEAGFVRAEVLDRHLPPDRFALEYFVCGPLPMVRAVERSLAALHVPARRMHSELFDWV